jgi:hypothetical protein
VTEITIHAQRSRHYIHHLSKLVGGHVVQHFYVFEFLPGGLNLRFLHGLHSASLRKDKRAPANKNE